MDVKCPGCKQPTKAGERVNRQTVTIYQPRNFFVVEELGVYCPKR